MEAEKKIQKRYKTMILGFPMLLLDVPMEKLRGEWAPAINFDLLEDAMGICVPLKRARLSGNELRFLRLHLNMSQEEFGAQFEYTRQGVKKWEAIGNALPPLKWSTERDIRLFALNWQIRNKSLDPAFFYRAYELLVRKAPAEIVELSVRMEKLDRPEAMIEECLLAC